LKKNKYKLCKLSYNITKNKSKKYLKKILDFIIKEEKNAKN